MKLPCLILIFATNDAEHRLFSRVKRVANTNHGLYTLSSNTVLNHGICAKYCKSEECRSFSYTVADKRCETYFRSIGEKPDINVSMATMYFAKVFNSCSEVSQKHPSGIYRIATREGVGVDVVCEMDTTKGPWIVIQRRTNGDVDFYRSWIDYKYGFGDMFGDFWIADAMTSVDGQPFTTYDRDNDDSNVMNCAEFRHSGWWFKNCTRTNLNGRYQSHSQDLTQAITWAYFPDDQKFLNPLKMTTMKIR